MGYRRAQPFNLPAQPFNLSISDKLWTLEKNKGHFIIPEFNSTIIKWPLFFSKVHSLSGIDRLKGCAGRLKGCALRYATNSKRVAKRNSAITDSILERNLTYVHDFHFLCVIDGFYEDLSHRDARVVNDVIREQA